MGWGSMLGGALGGVGGFLVGGPAGAAAGFGAGSALGGAVTNKGPGSAQSAAGKFQPYQYDKNSFQNPYLNQEQSNIGAQQNRVGNYASPYSQMQSDYLKQLQGQAQGTSGPSVADLSFQNYMNQANQGIAGQVQGARNVNAGSALRAGLNAQAMTGVNGANQAAQLRANEQLNSQGQYLNALNSAQGQNLQQFGLQNQAQLGLLGQSQNAYQSQFGANQNLQQLMGNQYLGAAQQALPYSQWQYGQDQKNQGNLYNALGTVGTTFGNMFS